MKVFLAVRIALRDVVTRSELTWPISALYPNLVGANLTGQTERASVGFSLFLYLISGGRQNRSKAMPKKTTTHNSFPTEGKRLLFEYNVEYPVLRACLRSTL